MLYRKLFATLLGSSMVVCAAASPAWADSWATLKGRFVYDGEPPQQEKVEITSDKAVCSAHHPLKEDLVVGENGGLANVVVWVRTKDVAVHPDLREAPAEAATMDNHFCRFDPHIIPVRVGQPLKITNSDSVNHNSLGLPRKNPQFNVNVVPNGSKELTFGSEERLPVEVKCAIHPWMKAYLLIQDHPYMAVSDEDGNFQIENLPTGVELEFQVWQESAGYVREVSQDSKDLGWERGRFTVTLKEGVTDLGEVMVSPKLFEE